MNKSIFNGIMTEEEMLEEHPAELKYLERATEALEKQKKYSNINVEKHEDHQ